MADNTGLLGGFTQFGLPDELTQEELLRQRQQQRITNALEAAQKLPTRGGQRDLATGGAAIGAGLRNFFSKKRDIKPQEVAMFKARSEAKAEFDRREKAGDFSDLTEAEKAIERGNIQSRAAANNGLSDQASKLALDSANAGIALQKAESEQKFLEGKVEAQDITRRKGVVGILTDIENRGRFKSDAAPERQPPARP